MKDSVIRLRVRCRGAVQGVGFRPTVHRIATSHGLSGWVLNDPGGATVEVEGPAPEVRGFPDRLRTALPPLARLDAMEVAEIPVVGDTTFEVRESRAGRRAGALVPPDAALCHDCRRELDDPADRRHRYPFTTCTNCGPRFSLVRRLPYDRPTTSMACFPMCPACEREYTDPGDRRFHAEPICCPDCGPRLRFLDAAGTEVGTGPGAIVAARRALLDGAVVAVKGLGGFQLACRADVAQPVQTLRARKRRPTKPFAVMVRGLDEAERLVRLTDADRRLMVSPRSPVVLAPRLPGCAVADEVSPGIDDLGVMLPTTPLHVELLRSVDVPPLVMTSGNLSEEPICRGNREAVERLAGIADAFLLHDRDVVRRVDDSVVRSCSDGPVVVRRARGWVPEPLPLPVAVPAPVLAVGGHLQATACVAVGDQAFLSQHVGDLDSEAARRFLAEVIAGLEDFLQVKPALIACDPHPDYSTTWLARELAAARGGRVLEVQHHLAHAAAVLAEHGRFPKLGEEVLAVSLDGTGWGSDGTAWGGEWLRLGGDLGWRRVAHLEPLPLVGGERAVREPWRVAVAALARAGAAELVPQLPLARFVERDSLPGWRGLPAATPRGPWPRAPAACSRPPARSSDRWCATTGRARPRSSSSRKRPPGRARSRSGRSRFSSPADLPCCRRSGCWSRPRGGSSPVSRSSASRPRSTPPSALWRSSSRGASACGMTVALGGGCMVNRLLRNGLRIGLMDAGFAPLLATAVPPGDGGLAYGQAVVAAVAGARGAEPTTAAQRGR